MNPTGKIKKILVVDDDKTITALLKKHLAESGYEVTAMTEAADGLEYAMTQNPDLIILDVMMPIINGFNFCRLLKSEESKKNIPIILLTSRDKVKDIEIGLQMGASAYLTKPINIEELMKTIRMTQTLES